jgi:hypothetical protein
MIFKVLRPGSPLFMQLHFLLSPLLCSFSSHHTRLLTNCYLLICSLILTLSAKILPDQRLCICYSLPRIFFAQIFACLVPLLQCQMYLFRSFPWLPCLKIGLAYFFFLSSYYYDYFQPYFISPTGI